MFLQPFPSLNHNLLLDNYAVLKKDYEFLRDTNKFYDYPDVENGMEQLLTNPQNTGKPWLVSPLWHNKQPWPNLSAEVLALPTLDLIRQLSVQPILVCFSIVAANHTLDDHEDHDEREIAGQDNTFVVKYHYGIDVPEGNHCGLVVSGATERVENGKLNIFNESLTHHVYNHSTQPRAVFILSFLNSDLVPATVGV
jgi:hypothetical protein